MFIASQLTDVIVLVNFLKLHHFSEITARLYDSAATLYLGSVRSSWRKGGGNLRHNKYKPYLDL